jgi:hypothetical protein
VSNVSWPGKRATIRAVVRVAADASVIFNVHFVRMRGEGRVLVNGQSIVAATDLGTVSIAWEIALAGVQSWRVHCSATVALSVIFEARVTEAVALALSNAGFNGHVPGTLTGAVLEGPRRPILETSRGYKRSERLEARGQLKVGGMSVLEQREDCNSQERLGDGHGG